jgi:hypothetical protein
VATAVTPQQDILTVKHSHKSAHLWRGDLQVEDALQLLLEDVRRHLLHFEGLHAHRAWSGLVIQPRRGAQLDDRALLVRLGKLEVNLQRVLHFLLFLFLQFLLPARLFYPFLLLPQVVQAVRALLKARAEE